MKRLARPAIMTFFVLFLAVQLTVPALALSEPRPARWGWQMYSGVRTQSTFTIVRENGEHDDVALSDYLGYPRSEIELAERLPAHICEVEPDAVAVRTTAAFDDTVTETPCER